MSRKFSRSKKTKPRSQHVIKEIENSAQRIYLESGGADIDFLIESAKETVQLTRKRCAEPQMEGASDPLKLVLSALRELRLAEAMREKKLKLCQDLVAEAEQHKLEAAEPAATSTPQTHPQPASSAPPPPEPASASPESRYDQTGS